MRILTCALVVASVGCASESTYELVGGAQGVYDGQSLRVTASYQQQIDGVYSELLPASVVATVRDEAHELEQIYNDDPYLLFPKYHYEATIPVATALANGEAVTVDADGAPQASLLFPPAFALGEIPDSPVTMPLTVDWEPAAYKMEWWLTSPCIRDGEQDRHAVIRGDNDLTLYDEGHLTIESIYVTNGATTCEVTLWVDRYFETDTELVGMARQRRSVTFTANVESF
jgi:hypothetical protein